MQAFRAHKKYIEKEITILVNKLTMLKKQNKSPQEVLVGYNATIAKLNKLKETYTKLIEEEEDFYTKLKARINHLKEIQSHCIDFDSFFKTKLDRIILDYMLRQGYFESARLFARISNINHFSDLPVFQEIQSIKIQLEEERKCDKALVWCTNNRTKLSKMNSQIEF